MPKNYFFENSQSQKFLSNRWRCRMLVRILAMPKVQSAVKKFLWVADPWYGYLKHSPGSGESNAHRIMCVRRIEKKRHTLFQNHVENRSLKHLFNLISSCEIYIFIHFRSIFRNIFEKVLGGLFWQNNPSWSPIWPISLNVARRKKNFFEKFQ